MKTREIFAAATLLGILTVATFAYGQPSTINFQGRLTDKDGIPWPQPMDIEFVIYDAPTGGTPLWAESHSAVDVMDGLFSVPLGSVTPIPPETFDGAQRWLAIRVGTDDEMIPRTEIASVGYAYHALTADQALQADNDWCGIGSGLLQPCTETDKVLIGEKTLDLDPRPPVQLTVESPQGTIPLFLKQNALPGITPGMVYFSNQAGRVGEIGTHGSNNELSINGDHGLVLWVGGNSSLYVESTEGKVGIGTEDPPCKFTVNDGDALIAGGKLRVQTANVTALGGCYMEMYGNEIKGGCVLEPGLNPIHIKPGDNQSAVLLAEDGGNVGIGTTDPGAKAHVVSDILGGVAVLGDGYTGLSGQGGAIGVAGSGSQWAGYFDGNGYFSGNVAIGTMTPGTKLHVAGSVRIDGDEGGSSGTVTWTDDARDAEGLLNTLQGASYVLQDFTVDTWLKIYVDDEVYYMPLFK